MNSTLTKSLNAICVWIDQTPLSQAIQVTNWVVPAEFSSIHTQIALSDFVSVQFMSMDQNHRLIKPHNP